MPGVRAAMICKIFHLLDLFGYFKILVQAFGLQVLDQRPQGLFGVRERGAL